MSDHDSMSDSELSSLMQCALVGPSRTALVDALVRGFQTGQDPASPKTCLPTALRLVPGLCLPKYSLLTVQCRAAYKQLVGDCQDKYTTCCRQTFVSGMRIQHAM